MYRLRRTALTLILPPNAYATSVVSRTCQLCYTRLPRDSSLWPALCSHTSFYRTAAPKTSSPSPTNPLDTLFTTPLFVGEADADACGGPLLPLGALVRKLSSAWRQSAFRDETTSDMVVSWVQLGMSTVSPEA